MRNHMKEVLLVDNVLQEVYPIIRELDSVPMFQMTLGMLIDQWSADHDLTVEESIKMIDDLVRAHRLVNGELGVMTKSRG